MIDIHCHLLPGVDDGPEDLEESLAMARVAVEDGIQGVVATPHFRTGVYPNTKPDILERLKSLQEALREYRIPLAVYPGSAFPLTRSYWRGLIRGKS